MSDKTREKQWIYKGKTMVFQKDSFWLAKGLLLMSKRTRFGMQKDPFWSAKGVLFEMYSFKSQFQPLSSRMERGKNCEFWGCYNPAIVKPAITMLTIDMSLMRMLSDGPEVSLNGSPTVSPTIVALWFSLPLPP